MKCKNCGKDVADNTVFCPFCHENTFNLDNSIDKKSNTPPIYKNPKIWIIFAIVLFLVIFFIAVAVIVPPYKSESFTYKTYTLGTMSYDVPKAWDNKTNDNGTYHYDSERNMLYVRCDYEFNYVDDDYFDGFINGLINSDGTSNSKEISKDYIYIDGQRTLHYIYTCTMSGKNMYMNVYAFQKSDNLYGFMFGSSGNKQSVEFDATETDIINSIRFNGTSVYREPTTEESTTEEPTTEKPTEPPTEKPTDITEPMTLLYDDSEISVYYSDVESSRYYDDRIEVHLFVKNKMDKQIEVQADTVILDGISYNKIVCSDPISANSRGMVELTVDDCNNTSPSTVGADLRYFNIESLRDTVRLNIVSQSIK